MTVEEAKEFIVQSVKSDVDIALVADAINTLEQAPCDITKKVMRDLHEFHNKLSRLKRGMQRHRKVRCKNDKRTER